ncbi:MAG: FecR domain-containing protein [Prevotella sp.]|nr:FecR domain-containing protein [Prevotella sp.]
MEDQDLTYLETQTLDIMEPENEISDDQISQLNDDPALWKKCHEIEALTTAFRAEREPRDVEAALHEFHLRYKHNTHQARNITIITALAAMIIGAVLLISRPSNASQHAPGIVYAASTRGAEVVIRQAGTTEKIVPASTKVEGLSFKTTDINTEQAHDVSLEVPEGRSFTVELPDGSRVWLHPGSTIYFPSRFASDSRQVKIVGEAYFSVTHDASRPFSVQAGNTITTVLGTEFDVSSYDNEPVTVTLVSGSVNIVAEGGKHLKIKPNTQAVLAKGDQWELHTVDTEKFTNWRDGYFYFDNTPLRDILTEIGRNYGTTIQCTNEALLQEHLHFVAERTQSLQDIMDRLKELHPMSVTMKDNVLIVK